MRIRRVKGFIFGSSVIFNMLIFAILFTPLTEQLYKPLKVSEQLQKSEVIVIPSGSGYECGALGFMTEVRLRKGLELYLDGWADKIICSGGSRFTGINKSIAELMRETLILYGVPPDDILTQDETINSYNDISYLLKKYEDNFDFNRSIFVTSSFHTYRVRQILRKKNIAVLVVSAEPYELRPRIWSERLELFRVVIREYLAICYFRLRGYI